MDDSLNIEDVTKYDVWKTDHNHDSNKESYKFIYDVGAIINRAYGIKIENCTSSKT